MSNRKVLAAMALALPFTALAQETAPADVAADADAGSGAVELETVTVTAERRTENVKDVPISVSTLGGEALDVLNSSGQDVRLLSARLPSLNIESSFGRAFPRFYIRGYGNTDFHLNASQPVSLVIDEVVQENPILKGFPIFDVDQVEVLRGPQGTLFGRNTPAGVVKFDSAKPVFTPGGYFSVSEATYNTANVEGAINLPVNEEWALRLSVLYQHRDDYVDNEYTGEDDAYEGYDDRAVRFQALYAPSQDFSALFNAHARDLGGTARLFRANIFEQGSNDFADGFDEDEVYLDGDNDQTVKTYGSNLRLKWSLGEFALSSITGFETVDAYSRGDVDGGYGCGFCGLENGPGFVPFPSETADGIRDHQQWSQEFRIESDTGGPLGWQAGVYYFYEDYTIESFSYDTLAGGVLSEYADSSQTNKAWAGFGSLSYQFTEALSGKAGLRVTRDEKDFETDVANYYNASGATLVGDEFSADPSDSQVNWDVSALYVLTPQTNLYARVATGFRGPSVQPASVFGPQSVADSETNLSYEVGVKSDLFDRRARIAFDVFAYTVDDQQLSAVGGAGNQTTLINADKTVGRGAELDFQAYLIDHLLATLGASYNFTEIRDGSLAVYPCGTGLCTPTDPAGDTPGTVSIDNNPLPQAPKWVANATLRYGIPTDNGEYFFYTDWSYRSKVNFFLYEAEEFEGKPLLEGGVRIGYNWSDARYELAAFGRNITDQRRAVGAIDFDNLTGFLNEPRIFGVQFIARY
jgi:iron complex outermembrane receptor protein